MSWPPEGTMRAPASDVLMPPFVCDRLYQARAASIVGASAREADTYLEGLIGLIFIVELKGRFADQA
jgi:hypothetical protein